MVRLVRPLADAPTHLIGRVRTDRSSPRRPAPRIHMAVIFAGRPAR
jgi:hypothetical protein